MISRAHWISVTYFDDFFDWRELEFRHVEGLLALTVDGGGLPVSTLLCNEARIVPSYTGLCL